MTHICRFLQHKTQSTGREYRACPICGNTPAVQIEGESTERERLVLLDKQEPCFFSEKGEADRKVQR